MYDDLILRAEDKKINWYPGHMARARRQLAEQLSRVDVVVELCDARIPRASRNPDLNDLVKNKKRLLVLNKSDLAQENVTRAWLAYYRTQGVDCMSFDATRGRAQVSSPGLKSARRRRSRVWRRAASKRPCA